MRLPKPLRLRSYFLSGLLVASLTTPAAFAVTTDFETLATGSGSLVTEPFSGISGFAFLTNSNVSIGSPVADPIQGILASSLIGTGKAAYLGGSGTNLSLPASVSYLTVPVFPGHPADVPTQRITSGQPLRTVTADFIVERNAGTNNQSYFFYIFDASDLSNPNTSGYHSYVRIAPDNSIQIADNSTALAAAGYVYTSTGNQITPGVPYRLTVSIDYTGATWSASIAALNGPAFITIATDRAINTGGYVLSGWTTDTTVGVVLEAVASASNKDFADRLIFDNLTTTDTARPALDLPVTFDTLPIGPGRLVSDPFTGFTGFVISPGGNSSADPLHGVLATSPLGTGRAGYLGGAGTNLSLPASPTYVSLLAFPGSVFDLPQNRITSAAPLRRVTTDFVLQRNAGTNSQGFNFYLYDARDASDANTFGYHSYVRIAPDNTVQIADNSTVLAAAGYVYTNTPHVLQSGTSYRLSITVNYTAATWSASIVALNGTATYVVAQDRPINTGGYVLSGWTNASGQASIDIELTGVASSTNRAFADRLIFDNIQTVDTLIPAGFNGGTTDFETFATGSGRLVTEPFSGVSGFAFLTNSNVSIGTPISDPIQGILASSPIGTGKAAYLGGSGTNLNLPASASYLNVPVFPGHPTDIPTQRITSDAPLRTVTADFIVQRNAGTNNQSYFFYIFDASDSSNPNTAGYHSYVRIAPDNSIQIADNSTALAAAGYVYTSTGNQITPGVPYRLTVSIDYTGATWSASIAALNGPAFITIATDRAINTGGYVLSGWTTDTTVGVVLEAVASASNKDFADRLIFDNLTTTDTARPALDLPVTFDTLPIGPGRLVSDPFTGFTGFVISPGGNSSADPLHGVLATSPLGTGRAGYLGGAGTNLSLPASPTYVSLLAFPGSVFDLPQNRITSAAPLRRVTTDFVLQRNAGTNSQGFNFYLYDARDASDANTFGYHSYVRIAPDNTVQIADNSTVLAAAGYVYTNTPHVLQSGTSYRLSITVNYTAATWSASIVALNGTATYVVAQDRPINTGGYVLSGWTNASGQASIDIELTGVASSTNRAFADRLIFDDIQTIDTPVGAGFTAALATASLPPAQRGPLDDPDADGVPNLLEYALGLNPAAPTASPVTITMSPNDGTLTLTYDRAHPAEVIYQVQSTTNLSDPNSWTAFDVNQGSTESDGTTSAAVPIGTGPRYLRLSVTLAP